MGLFGSDEEEREEVTLGLSQDKKEEESGNKTDSSPEVGTINFDSEEDSSDKESSNLRNEVSKLDSVKESTVSSTDTGNDSSDLEEIKRQNQKIIEKLDNVLSRL